MIEDYYKILNHKVNLFIVYITEAHATDVWNIGESAGELIESHKTIEERLVCVKNLCKKYELTMPIYADNMNSDFETIFAGWPFRYFVTVGSKIVKIGAPKNGEFEIEDLTLFVDKLI